MATQNVIRAYWGSGSAPAWRMLLCLEEKGLHYESHQLSFSNKEHKSPEILKLNPRGKLPILVDAREDGEHTVYESLAIVEYLEYTYPEHPLLPPAHKARAEVLKRMHEVCYFSEAVTEAARYVMQNKKEEWNKEKIAELKGKVFAECEFWNGVLDNKHFVAGHTVTLADVVFYPYLAVSMRFGLPISKFPNLEKYYKMYSERPQAIKTTPPHWKETPNPASIYAF
eukprot:TRINITY_DN426_c0_g1_i1.p1 TRINITY_DN426_c0_g1~~TRINITY_DN426_c0_g1_i1.p1  ORF type:complete len:226 (+),score=47.27 TRINITY_DN426_c0_g1_i1:94-771(+)